jgi:hypothetical protein
VQLTAAVTELAIYAADKDKGQKGQTTGFITCKIVKGILLLLLFIMIHAIDILLALPAIGIPIDVLNEINITRKMPLKAS